jgi:transcriptional antiterminator RfaH
MSFSASGVTDSWVNNMDQRTSTKNLRASLAPLASPEPLIPASFPLGRAWHVIRTNVNCERRALKGIEALGFPVYMPVERKWVRHARKRERVERPLFVRYLFVHFDVEREHWYPIRATHGVETILCRDGFVPARVADSWVEDFRRAEAAGLFDATIEGAVFEKGSKVQVEEGPFAGLVGEVVRADSKHRIEILLGFLHRAVAVTVPVTAVRKG